MIAEIYLIGIAGLTVAMFAIWRARRHERILRECGHPLYGCSRRPDQR